MMSGRTKAAVGVAAFVGTLRLFDILFPLRKVPFDNNSMSRILVRI